MYITAVHLSLCYVSPKLRLQQAVATIHLSNHALYTLCIPTHTQHRAHTSVSHTQYMACPPHTDRQTLQCCVSCHWTLKRTANKRQPTAAVFK